MKLRKLSSGVAGLCLVLTLASCDVFGKKAEAASPTTEPTPAQNTPAGPSQIPLPASTAAPTSGQIPIDAFGGLTFRTVQDNDATSLTWEEVTVTNNAGGVITTTTTKTSKQDWDTANIPTIYYDVYFTDNIADIKKDTSLVYQTQIAEQNVNAGGVPTISVTPAQLQAKLQETSWKIGKPYAWCIVAKDAQGNILQDVTDYFTLTPPRKYTVSEMSYDFKGWYIAYAFNGNYETLIADVYLSDSLETAKAVTTVPVHAYYDGTNTVIKYYPGTLTIGGNPVPSINTAYYTYLVTRDEAATATSIVSAGNVERIVPHKSVSLGSSWDFWADKGLSTEKQLKEIVATTSDNRLVNLSWANLIPIDLPAAKFSVNYTINIGTSAAALTAGTYSLKGQTLSSGRPSVALNDLAYNTTYYAQVTAVGTYVDASSVPVANRTWTSPIIQFTTPDCLTVKKYSFATGNDIPTVAVLSTPGEIIRSGTSTPVDYGNPAPALSMTASESIKTTMAAAANTYTGGTFAFDFKPTSEATAWTIAFDNLSAPSSFTPATYDVTNPSAQYGMLHGPVIALRYYADDPMTTAMNDPSFAICAYTLVADAAVDATPMISGDAASNDADTNPDVKETRIATFATYTSGIADKYKRWHTVTIKADSVAQTVTVTLNGVASTPCDFTSFRTLDGNCINIQGLNSMTFTALSNLYVDNVQWTAENKNGAGTVIPYVQSVR